MGNIGEIPYSLPGCTIGENMESVTCFAETRAL